MKVSEAIDRLEVGDTVWVKATVNAINFEGGYIRAENTKTSIYLDGDAEISLTEPQAERVEVKQCVAEFYEANKDDLNFAIYEAVAHSIKECGYKAYPEGFMDWLVQSSNNPFETLIRMKGGYTVKPKRWVVKYLRHRCYYYFVEWANTDTFDPIGGPDLDYLKVAEFTDRKKAEAVATLIDGSVEEV